MVTFLAMVVFGGLGHIWGGIIGAIIITIVYDLTRPLYEYQLFIFGLTLPDILPPTIALVKLVILIVFLLSLKNAGLSLEPIGFSIIE